MSKARTYLPIAASSSRRPLIPNAPVPVIRPLARAVRVLMGGGRAIVLGLSRPTALRIFAMMGEQLRAELEERRK